MQINVAQLLKEPIGATREYPVDEMAALGEDGREYPLQGSVKLVRTQHGILVKGTVETETELECSRCLGGFRHQLTLTFQEEFRPTLDIVSGTPLPPPEEEGTFTIDEHHIIDLDEVIRQYTLLAIPMKPLCRVDCAGLCPACGDNLNRGPCDCPVPAVEPRWAKLSNLSKQA